MGDRIVVQSSSEVVRVPAPTLTRVAVSERAVVQRINRKLRAVYEEDGIDLHELKKNRGARAIQELGDYYVLDCRANFVIEDHVDPEDYARELGVLAPFESVHARDAE